MQAGEKDILYRIHPENNVPQILHNPSGFPIAQLGMYNPFSNLNIVLHWPFSYSLARNGELSTAGDCDCRVATIQHSLRIVGRGCAGFVEDFLPHLARDVLVGSGGFLAAWGPVAAEVHVAVLLDEW